MKSIYLPEPKQELREATLYYEELQAGLGETFLSAAEEAEGLLLAAPDAWKKLDKNIRRISLQRFPYSLIYTTTENTVIILAVSHHRRRPDYWKPRVT